MGPTAAAASIIVALIAVFVTLVSLGNGVPIWVVLAVLTVLGLAFGLVNFIRSRFTAEGQAERAMAEGTATKGSTFRTRTFAYVVVALGSLIAGLQGLYNPEQGIRQKLSVSGLLMAAVFGVLAIREYRTAQIQPGLTLLGEPHTPPKPIPLGSQRTTLIVLAILVIFLTITDIRLIVAASAPSDVWIGTGQMMIWLPVFGYLAYRELRRMKEKSIHPEKSRGTAGRTS